MFERYTERARRVVFFARYEASQLGYSEIEIENFVLGIAREDKKLWSRIKGPSLELLRSEIESSHRDRVGPKLSTSVDMALSKLSKAALKSAATEAEELSSRHIGPEHLLLGVLKHIGRRPPAQLLRSRGVTYNNVRIELCDADKKVRRASRERRSELSLAGMHLKALPPMLGEVKDLRQLDVSQNMLTQLPESIGELQSLEELDLSNNALVELPRALLNLTSLKWINLYGNPELDIPPEIFSESPGNDRFDDAQKILSYYFKTTEGSSPLNEAKLVLVGRGGVGKTSLLRRLIWDRFDPLEPETPGINIARWRILIPAKDSVRLNVWDFGGQEIMHATHQFFLSERSLYILVLSGRENTADSDAEYWLKLIDSFGGRSPLIVVLNKSSEFPFDVNQRALQRKYPIRAFVKTDCATGIGLNDLREVIAQETDKLEHVRAPFPANWFKIKDTLARTHKNFLPFEEYRNICTQGGEPDPSAQDELASILHNLGIALNYKDDPRLEHAHVLNPHWVTNGIYAVLNSPTIKSQRGEMRLRDVGAVLNEHDYPIVMRRFLVDLMKKFELCFSFTDDECHYLVPELLDIQEPEDVGLFLPDECLNLEYHYDILPEGLLPRFIVRTHVLSEGRARWRSGVILALEGNTALVRADREARKIVVRVAGPSPSRRRLLAVIRSDFERIHRSIPNLKPREMVPVPEQAQVLVSYDDLVFWEGNGRSTYPVRIADNILDLDVRLLLDGVDLKERVTHMKHEYKSPPAFLFYSYSHHDEALRNELETHLKILQRQGLIEPWHDREIEAGQDWRKEISEHLERADIILLLVSADFIASDYCYEVEMKRALEKHKKKDACVIPIILREVNWKSAPFHDLLALPKDGKAVLEWPNRDSAWRNVSEGIERAIKTLKKPARTSAR